MARNDENVVPTQPERKPKSEPSRTSSGRKLPAPDIPTKQASSEGENVTPEGDSGIQKDNEEMARKDENVAPTQPAKKPKSEPSRTSSGRKLPAPDIPTKQASSEGENVTPEGDSGIQKAHEEKARRGENVVPTQPERKPKSESSQTSSGKRLPAPDVPTKQASSEGENVTPEGDSGIQKAHEEMARRGENVVPTQPERKPKSESSQTSSGKRLPAPDVPTKQASSEGENVTPEGDSGIQKAHEEMARKDENVVPTQPERKPKSEPSRTSSGRKLPAPDIPTKQASSEGENVTPEGDSGIQKGNQKVLPRDVHQKGLPKADENKTPLAPEETQKSEFSETLLGKKHPASNIPSEQQHSKREMLTSEGDSLTEKENESSLEKNPPVELHKDTSTGTYFKVCGSKSSENEAKESDDEEKLQTTGPSTTTRSDVYNNDLSKKPKHMSKREETSKIVFTFRSGKEDSKKYPCDYYNFKKWSFFMTEKETKNIIKKHLKDLQSEIKLKTSGYIMVEFSSESHEKDFDQWVEKCLKLTDDCFKDLQLLVIKGPSEEIQDISGKVKQSALVIDGFVSAFEERDICGVFLLGRGENVIDLLLDLQRHMKNATLWSPESNEEISYHIFECSPLQWRLFKVFDRIEQAVEIFPQVKIYKCDMRVKVIGNKKECADAIKFLSNNYWLKDIKPEVCKGFEGFEFFLSRENVQAFIDSRIRCNGTWAVSELAELPNTKILLIYGKTDEEKKEIAKVLQESIRWKKYSITYSPEIEHFKQWCTKEAGKLEESSEKKFTMKISKEEKPAKLEVVFVYTMDLEDNESLKMFMNEAEAKISTKYTWHLDQKAFKWIQTFHKEELQEEARKNEIALRFLKRTVEIEMTGSPTALKEMQKYIASICMKEQHILLPIEAMPPEVKKFLSENQCFYEYSPDKHARYWIRGKTAFVLHNGKEDDVFADVYVKSQQLENTDKNFEWPEPDERTAFMKYPLWQEGENREKHKMDSVLVPFFQEVTKYKKKSVSFDLKDNHTWPVQKFVKRIIDCAPKPPDGLIIILCHSDEAEFQNVVSCIEEVESKRTEKEGLPKIKFQVIKGKIAELEEEVDVIVNTTALNLDLTSGAVSKSILNAAGNDLKSEIAKIPIISKTGHINKRIDYGDVQETKGYRLKCKKIFHGALFPWNDGNDKALKILEQFVKACINGADRGMFKTMAFPAIGTGQLKIPAEEVANCVKKVVDEYAASHNETHIEKIMFVIYEKDEENFRVFKRILEESKDCVQKAKIPPLYRMSVCGEEHNIIGAMNLLEGLFHEHIIQNYEMVKHAQKGEAIVTPKPERNDEVQPKENIGSERDISEQPAAVSKEDQRLAVPHEDQFCLILSSKDGGILSEKNIGPLMKDVECENIICPFLKDGCALIRFKSVKDAETFFNKFSNEQFDLRKIPNQAINNVKAKLCSNVISILERNGITSKDFKRKTGACICMDTWTVGGNLLMIQNGEKFIKELVVKETETVPVSRKLENNLASEPKLGTVVPRKCTKMCTEYQEKALRELFPDLPFRNVELTVKKGEGMKLIRGSEKNVKIFEKALDELEYEEISPVTEKQCKELMEIKFEGVSVSFQEDKKSMIIFSRISEVLKKCLAQYQKSLQDSIEIPVNDFNAIVYFEKSLCQEFPKKDDKVIISGPRSMVEKYKAALAYARVNYTTQRVIISENVKDEAEMFISSFSSQNDNIYIRLEGMVVFITSPNKNEVFKAKQEVDHHIDKIRKNKIKFDSKKGSGRAESTNETAERNKPDVIHEEKGIKVFTLNFDFMRVNVDVIVNPSDEKLHSKSGLSYHICKVVGHEVQDKCTKFIKAQRDGILPIGKTFVTDGGKKEHLLKIIHVNIPRWENYADTENPCEACLKDIISTVQACLFEPELEGAMSIAIPAISAGEIGSVPLQVCCSAYAKAVLSFIDVQPKRNKSKLKEIYFVDRDYVKLNSIKLAFHQKQHWVFHKSSNDKDYYLGSGLVVKIFPAMAILTHADALVVQQDKDFKSERHIASELKKCKCTKYEKQVASVRGRYVKDGSVKSTCAPESLKNIKKVLHVKSPIWNQTRKQNIEKHIQELENCIKNLLKEASVQKLESIIIPIFGAGVHDDTLKKRVFRETARIIVKYSYENQDKTIRMISIVDENQYNISFMNLAFYDALENDSKQRLRVDLVDVPRPQKRLMETEF
ncbi:uncharacterized protein LOC134264599 isoform X2 [Saccostrea cucullata]|uniref:uncharacterized protein LOC134264599 isoform X2 n=1 Tax=Saccostrea cuccullata TaxID=36930 RepID=UPI002ED42833